MRREMNTRIERLDDGGNREYYIQITYNMLSQHMQLVSYPGTTTPVWYLQALSFFINRTRTRNSVELHHKFNIGSQWAHMVQYVRFNDTMEITC
mmetsp:Transcript_3597/g.6827  ORF Transcript_3597/g.6827 Transcript_3597/m.6827 type:complete len:94 (-) Transcript_3597:779-1060(-)